jgi:hypothetical protein
MDLNASRGSTKIIDGAEGSSSQWKQSRFTHDGSRNKRLFARPKHYDLNAAYRLLLFHESEPLPDTSHPTENSTNELTPVRPNKL